MKALIMLNRLATQCNSITTHSHNNCDVSSPAPIFQNCIEELLFVFCKVSAKHALVHLYQRSLQRLASLAMHQPSAVNLFSAAVLSLYQLMELFPAYFNYNEEAIGIQEEAKKLRRRLSVIQQTIIDATMTQLLRFIIGRLGTPCSWYEWKIQRHACSAVLGHSEYAADPLQFAVWCNLCDPEVINLLKEHILQRSTSLVNMPLSQLRAQINAMPCSPHLPVNHELSLKEQLLAWLDNNSAVIAGDPASAPTPAILLRTPLSVSQLAAFLRLLVNANIISCNNQTQLLNLIAAHVKTNNMHIISAQSLRNKFYSLELNTISFLKDLVITLLNHARKLQA